MRIFTPRAVSLPRITLIIIMARFIAALALASVAAARA